MIRDFSFKDLIEVNGLLKEFNYEINKDSFDNDFLKVLVYVDKKIIGVLVYEDLIDSLSIDYLVVEENNRKKGIATKLLKSMENGHNNYLNSTLEVRESNNTAISFYEKNGFKKATIRKNYYKNENGILMIKEYR